MEPDPWGSRPANPPQSFGQAPPRPAAPITLPPRGRPVVIALVAVIVEIVIVAAFGNQAVTKEIVKGYTSTSNLTLRGVLQSSYQYTWRFSSGGPILFSDRLWAAQLVSLATLFVLTFLLVLAIVRGPVTFGRAFFGTWMAVIIATLLGSLARNSIYDFIVRGAPRTFANVVWTPAGLNSYAFVAGLGLGLVAALITALVAVASRHPAQVITPAEPAGFAPPPLPEPAAPPPFSPDGPSLYKDPTRAGDRTEVISRDTGSAWPSAAAGGIGAGAGAAAAATRDSDTTDTRRLDVPTQAHPTLDEPTQAHPAVPDDEPSDEPSDHPSEPNEAPASDEQAVGHEPPAQSEAVPTNATVQLPRFEPGQEPWKQPATTDRGADTNELPPVDPGPRFPGSDPSLPQQTHFPRPPNDEDLGHDHHDD